MIQTVSIKETRNRLADLVTSVEMLGDEVVITKFGRPRAMLVPIYRVSDANETLEEVFGAWRKRKDIDDSGRWVRRLRTRMSLRQK